MKCLSWILAAVVTLVSIPSCLLASEEFEGFSATVSATGNFCISSFGYIPVESTTAGEKKELYLDEVTNYPFGLDVSTAYNWNDKFIGISVFGYAPLKGYGTYETHLSLSNGQSSQGNSLPYYIDQYMVGAILELGWCRTAQSWVFVRTGRSAGTTYGPAKFHAGIGAGPYYRKIKSDLPVIDGSDKGWVGSLRFQYLLFWDLGIDCNLRAFFQKPYDKRMVLSAGIGVFYKLF